MPRLAIVILVGAVFLAATAAAQQPGQLSSDQQAAQLLNAGQRAYNEASYPAAADRFREFLRTFASHRDAPQAHYGLALSLMETAPQDAKTITDELAAAVAGNFAQKPYALYRLGAMQRSAGLALLRDVAARPAEATQLTANANAQFEQAARSFAAAAAGLAQLIPPPSSQPEKDPVSPQAQWRARALCDQCEMLLRMDRPKDAAALARSNEPAVSRTACAALAAYQRGHATFLTGDYAAAGKTLADLAPFDQDFGPHARYLLARCHQASGQRAEAAAQFKALLADWDGRKKAAATALQNPGALKPPQVAAYQAIANGPAPDYWWRATFYLGLLLAEEDRYPEAGEKFTLILQQQPKSPLAADAQLRLGYCLMQQRNYAEALKQLTPLAAHPRLADQALWWQARSQMLAADPANAAAYDPAVKAAIALLVQAADKANQLAASDATARVRRADILMELGDAQQAARQYREAAATYQAVVSERANPRRVEEASQRIVTAMHLAGAYSESNNAAVAFEKSYPKSVLLAVVLFRAAENAYLAATAAADAPGANAAAVAPQFDEAARRYDRLIQQFPEFEQINLARLGLATCRYRAGKYAETAAVLKNISDADRNGELAPASYLLADCLLRTLPPEGADALDAARLLDQIDRAAKLLDGFVAGQPKHPLTPDAMLKLGYCYQRTAALIADPAERTRTLQSARETYDKLRQSFPADAVQPAATFERAKCLAAMGDLAAAQGELLRFSSDAALAASPVAPMALLRASLLLRAQGKAQDAANLMAQCRQRYEPDLPKDPARADWAPMLQYEHAVALKESGKPADAKPVFENLARQFPNRPEVAGAVWRLNQIKREDLVAAAAGARAVAANPAADANAAAQAQQAVAQTVAALRQNIEFLSAQADTAAKVSPKSPGCLRILYEIAWCQRLIVETELEAARATLVQAETAKAKALLATAQTPSATLRPVDVPMSAVPSQPGEKPMLDAYRKLIQRAGDDPLASIARFEVAEFYCLRDNPDAADQELADALEKCPPGDLAERMRLRLAAVMLSKGNARSAASNVQAIRRMNPNSGYLPIANYIDAEARIIQQDWTKAIELLAPFRDQQPLATHPLADRALLRLSFAAAQAQQWDVSRQAAEVLVQRYAASPLAAEAYFNAGLAWQKQKNYDAAANCYAEVIRRTLGATAARAQFQVGQCRLDQNRPADAAAAFVASAVGYNYPEIAGEARCEAAKAYASLKQRDDAIKQYELAIRTCAGTRWAQVAQQRLTELKAEK